MSLPKVAVQILLYSISNEELDGLMLSLEKVDYPKEQWRLVVVKNFLNDRRLEEGFKKLWLPRSGQTLPEIIYFEQKPNLGFAGGHLLGQELSASFAPDYLYLLNEDTVVAPDFLTKVVAMGEDSPKAALIQSLVMLDDGRRVNSIGNAMHFLGFGFTLGHRQPLSELQNDLPMFFASGAGLLVRTSFLKKLGGLFDPLYFLYHEDLDLSWRARLAGHEILLAPDSKIFHRYEFSKSVKKFYFLERNRHLTNLVNYKWPTLLLLAPAALMMELGALAFSFKSGWWKEKICSYFYFFRPAVWRWIFRRRATIRRFRIKTDREMLARMSGSIVNQEIDNPVLTRFVNPLTEAYLSFLKLVVFW